MEIVKKYQSWYITDNDWIQEDSDRSNLFLYEVKTSNTTTSLMLVKFNKDDVEFNINLDLLGFFNIKRYFRKELYFT